jgi:hypothetical protein
MAVAMVLGTSTMRVDGGSGSIGQCRKAPMIKDVMVWLDGTVSDEPRLAAACRC